MASLVYSEGLSLINTRTRGTTIGVARVGLRNGRTAIGGGIYQGHTSGTRQTILSKMAAPPRMRTGFVIFLGIISTILGLAAVANLTSEQYLTSLYQGSIAGILMIALLSIYKKQRRTYDAASRDYESTRLCQRCGTFYLGHALSEVSASMNSDQSNLRKVMLGFFIVLLVVSVAIKLLRGPEPELGTNAAISPSSQPSATTSDESSYPIEQIGQSSAQSSSDSASDAQNSGTIQSPNAETASTDEPITANKQSLQLGVSATNVPKLISGAPPAYPPAAWAKKISGVVTVSVLVDAQGMPTDLKIVKSVCPSLDLAAMQAAAQDRFEPAHDAISGAPMAMRTTINMNFQAQ
ncbi:MAG TPA: energy transducer TonB [Acidobacteriaceae bacterium]